MRLSSPAKTPMPCLARDNNVAQASPIRLQKSMSFTNAAFPYTDHRAPILQAASVTTSKFPRRCDLVLLCSDWIEFMDTADILSLDGP